MITSAFLMNLEGLPVDLESYSSDHMGSQEEPEETKMPGRMWSKPNMDLVWRKPIYHSR